MNDQVLSGVLDELRTPCGGRFRRSGQSAASSPARDDRPVTGSPGEAEGSAEAGDASAVVDAHFRVMSVRHTSWPVSRQSADIAIDLGSARTRAWRPGRRTILDVRTVAFPGADQSYPVRRGAIVDPEGTAQMLERLLGNRTSRLSRPVIAVTTPTLGGPAFREAVRVAVRPLRPRFVITVPRAEAIARGAGADTGRPLLIVDVGAQLTEVFLLTAGAVADAHCLAVGIDDLGPTACAEVVDYVADSVLEMLRLDRTSKVFDALQRGVLTAGGGALRPDITCRLAQRLHVPVLPAPAPHTAAVRGAGRLVQDLHRTASVAGKGPASPRS